jgi:hypothetical protein
VPTGHVSHIQLDHSQVRSAITRQGIGQKGNELSKSRVSKLVSFARACKEKPPSGAFLRSSAICIKNQKSNYFHIEFL